MDDWVSACGKVEVAGSRCKGRNGKTWKECVDDDMEGLGLHPEWVEGLHMGKRLTLA